MNIRFIFVILHLFFFGFISVAMAQDFQTEILTDQSEIIWGFDFLKDGHIIFTERGGEIKVFDPKTKKISQIQGVPKVWANGQGGLLDIRVHPKNKDQIFFTYSEPVGKKATTAVAFATLKGDHLTQFKKIFSAHEPTDEEIHFGSRIEFDGEGHLFVTIGERNQRKQVQDLKYHMGKVLRLNEDGTPVKGNPFFGRSDALPEIWSYGHRNPQGLVRNPMTGDLWLAEMGPRGGDEVNLIKAGANYGWPVVTYGREYYGPKIGEGASKAGMTDPVAYWVPSISPSAIAFYNGEAFPKWKGNLFLANLSGMHLRRLVLNGQKIVGQEELLRDQNLRFRNVRPGPDGFLYFSTDNGKLGRLKPL